MADIKTKDAIKGTIKTIDKVADVSARMKQAYISTKDKAETSTHSNEASANEYATDRVQSGSETIIRNTVYQADKQGRRAFNHSKDNYYKAKDAVSRFKEQRNADSIKKQTLNRNGSNAIKTVQKADKAVKTRTVSNKTIKTTAKGTVKTTTKSVKTAETTAKTTVKTAQQTAKAAQKTAEASAKAAQKAAEAAKATAKAAVAATKAAVKATIAIIKAIIAAVKSLIAAIVAGGWVAVLIIVIICLVALIACSVYGIFFSGEDSGTGQTMRTAVTEINTAYEAQIDSIITSNLHDVLEESGSRAVWKEVLAVYSVKVNTDPDNPLEVATMDDEKKELLSEIFWEMNSIDYRTERKTETEVTERDDGHGNIVETEREVTRIYLYITVSHKTVEEMADMYNFNQEQRDYLTELLKDENNQLWSSVLYGISSGDGEIISVAVSQIGNVGGMPYWSWYGFGSRVEWCACFVSWCANECGYIDSGVIPKYALCDAGVDWFKERSQWLDGNEEPSPGMIIFFDWQYDGLDGNSDHTGIVEKVEDGMVYTIEGNSGDTCRECSYPIGYFEILGYGAPAY